MIFTDWDKFAETVGVLDKARLRNTFRGLHSIGVPVYDDMGRFAVSADSWLKEFVRKNPSFHIVTETSDHDDLEFGGHTVSNSYRYVNRMAYFLADGDADDSHDLVEEYAEGEFD